MGLGSGLGRVSWKLFAVTHPFGFLSCSRRTTFPSAFVTSSIPIPNTVAPPLTVPTCLVSSAAPALTLCVFCALSALYWTGALAVGGAKPGEAVSRRVGSTSPESTVVVCFSVHRGGSGGSRA